MKKFALLSLMLFIAIILTACGSGGSSGSCEFYGYPNTLGKLTLSKDYFKINKGSTDKIIAYVDGIDKTNEATFTVKSEKEETATKNIIANIDKGTITAVKVGTAVINVHINNTEEDKTFTVNVIDPTLPTLQVVKNEINYEIGQDITDIESIIVTLNGQDVTNKVNFTSTDENVATVDENGNINIIGEGETQIIIHLDGANDQIVTIKVTLPELEINKNEFNLVIGEEAENQQKNNDDITVKLRGEDQIESGEAVFVSSDPNVATVDQDGHITAISEGTAIIKVSVEGAKTSEIKVNVYDPYIHSLTYTSTLQTVNINNKEYLLMYEGETGHINVFVEGVDKTNTGLYTSGNTNILTVDNENEHGKISALHQGETTLTLHHEEALKDGDIVVNVLIKPVPILQTEELNIILGYTEQIIINSIGKDDITKNYTFTSEDPSIATVDENGKVTLKSASSTTIYANYNDGINEFNYQIPVNQQKNLVNTGSGVNSTALSYEETKKIITVLMDTGMISNENDVDNIVSIDTTNGQTQITITIDRDDGTKVAVVAYEDGKIKYISTGEVQNKQVTVDIGNSNQNVVANTDSNGNVTQTVIEAGFYDDNNTLIASWNQVVSWGWQIGTDWDYRYITSYPNHFCNILANHQELANATKLVIPEGVKHLGWNSFSESEIPLHSIVFPNSYNDSRIAGCVSGGATRFSNFTIRSDNPNFDSIDGVVYTEDHKTFCICPINKTKVRILDGCTLIKWNAFAKNQSTSIGPIDSGADILVPNSVNTIEGNTFTGMPNLEWVEFWDGLVNAQGDPITSENIKSVYIPSSLTTMTSGVDRDRTYSFAYGLNPEICTLYIERTSKPAGWVSIWQGTSWFGTELVPVQWNVSRATYRANYRN